MTIKREELLSELKLREQIRKIIKIVHTKKVFEHQNANKEEVALRMHVRRLIREVADTEESPHRSTGINVLEDLLKKIIPVLETDYKSLTTEPAQRESFRAHVINAIENALSTEQSLDSADQEEAGLEVEPVVPLQEQDVSIDVEDEDPGRSARTPPQDMEKFIDIDPTPDEPVPTSPEADFAAGADLSLDQTGRNVAYKAFQKVETAITDSYNMLSAPEDLDLFRDYLLTNMKLYFDRFEEELQPNLEEPTTPEYEEEVAASDEAGMQPPPEEMGGEIPAGPEPGLEAPMGAPAPPIPPEEGGMPPVI